MKIQVGSTNKIKIEAVEEILRDYPHLAGAEIRGIKVASDVSEQPKSLKEVVKGAMTRAKNAFFECNYSFGIESGFMEVPNTKTGFMDVSACSIYDGKEFYLGLSSAWEAPKEVVEQMISKNVTMNQAAFDVGLIKDIDNSSKEGLIDILTKGRLTRKEYTKEAIRTALIHLEKN